MEREVAPCVGVNCRLCAPQSEAEGSIHLLEPVLRRESGWHVAEVYLDGEALREGASFPGHSHLLKKHCRPIQFVGRTRRSVKKQAEALVAQLVGAARREELRTMIATSIKEQHEAVHLGLQELGSAKERAG